MVLPKIGVLVKLSQTAHQMDRLSWCLADGGVSRLYCVDPGCRTELTWETLKTSLSRIEEGDTVIVSARYLYHSGVVGPLLVYEELSLKMSGYERSVSPSSETQSLRNIMLCFLNIGIDFL